MNNIKLRYTLCFLMCEDQVLMLLRNRPPNQGLWNGVGGHIEVGETPLNSCLREVAEETGIILESVRFNGLLTWEGFEIPAGGLFLFSTVVHARDIIPCQEGILAWQSQKWASSAPEVVNNLHIVLPDIYQPSTPKVFHFIYQDNSILNYHIDPLPSSVDIHTPWSE
jgi:8-oxo-dGTP diphosphatase